MASLVSKATTDDASPVPVFALREMAEATMQSIKESDNLRAALLARLSRSSPDIKFKTLRVIKYVCTNGRTEFKMAWQRDNAVIKQCLQFQHPTDELRGDRPAENVRTEAQACLDAIFAENVVTPQTSHIAVQSFGSGPSSAQTATTAGGAYNATSGSYGGFGSAPPVSTQNDEDSITGLNLRKNIVSAFLGEPKKAVYTPTASKYGGYGSDGGSSNYNNTFPTQPQPPQAQNGFHPTGLYGGDASNINSAREQGFAVQQQQSYNAAATSSGLGNKSGPWGGRGGQQGQQQQPPQQQQQRGGLPPEDYISRSGPTTRNSVQELGYEKRIVAQYTTNTPLKPVLTEVELKKFTNDSSSCAIDDMLIILHEIASIPNQPITTICKAVQLYNYIVQQCGMVTQECDKEHLSFFQHLYETNHNKHIQKSVSELLIGVGLIEQTNVKINSNVPNAFHAKPKSSQQQQQQASPVTATAAAAAAPQQDLFGLMNEQPPAQQQQQQQQSGPAQLQSSFDFLSLDSQQQQPPPPQQQQLSGKKKITFNKRPVAAAAAPKPEQEEESGFAFLSNNDADDDDNVTDNTEPVVAPTQPSNDLFALLGNPNNNNTTPAKQSLNLDALYSQSSNQIAPQQVTAPVITQQPSHDIFASMATPYSRPTPAATDEDDAFAFLTTQPAANTTTTAPTPVPAAVQSAKVADAFADLNF